MKNVCPHCGRMIENGEQAFDLTEYFGRQIRRYMSSKFESSNSNELTKYEKGMEKTFNLMTKNCPLVFSSNSLWDKPSITHESESTVKTILFRFPYSEILEHMEKLLSIDRNSLIETYKWYSAKKDFMEQMVFRLNLKKMSEGDIAFDTIADEFDSTPIARTRVCPWCHEKLSFWAGRYEEICISVLGGQRISKTTTLTAMASAFMEGYQGISWQGSTEDEMFKEFEKSCLTPYRKGKPISATKNIKGNISRISFKVRLGRIGYIVLTFVDLPGELNNENGIDNELFKRYQHYFDNVDFAWYCTDPGELRELSIGAQKGNLADELGLGDGRAPLRTEQICSNMNQMSGFFRNIPVAYILGKTDVKLIDKKDKREYHLFVKGGSVNDKNPPDRLPLDIESFWQEAYLVKKYMREMNPKLVVTFDQNFKRNCYFAMSAYGWNPIETEEPRRPEAYRCTVPFIWMLASKGYIPLHVRKRVRGLSGGFHYEDIVEYLQNLDENTKDNILWNLFMQGDYRIC